MYCLLGALLTERMVKITKISMHTSASHVPLRQGSNRLFLSRTFANEVADLRVHICGMEVCQTGRCVYQEDVMFVNRMEVGTCFVGSRRASHRRHTGASYCRQ